LSLTCTAARQVQLDLAKQLAADSAAQLKTLKEAGLRNMGAIAARFGGGSGSNTPPHIRRQRLELPQLLNRLRIRAIHVQPRMCLQAACAAQHGLYR